MTTKKTPTKTKQYFLVDVEKGGGGKYFPDSYEVVVWDGKDPETALKSYLESTSYGEKYATWLVFDSEEGAVFAAEPRASFTLRRVK